MRSPLDKALSGAPGHSAEALRHKLIDDGMAKYFFAPAAMWIVALLEWVGKLGNVPRMPLVYAGLAAVLTIYGTIGFIRLRGKSANWKLGRDGERQVAHVLSTLNVPGARIFHDVPAESVKGGEFNLDHVIICDRGIYVIETKAWRKPLKPDPRITMRDGRIFRAGALADGDPVGQAAAVARWLGELLRRKTGRDFHCQPVLVFPGWMVEHMDPATRVVSWVLNPKILLGWIESAHVRLEPEEVHLVADSLMVHMREKADPE